MVRSSAFLLLCFVLLLSIATRVTLAGRQLPAPADKKGKDCFDDEGTVLIPGIGRYSLGSHEVPGFVGLDHSGPAAANGQYIPGADDTFVPNPGFEVPNPAHGTAP